MTYSGREIYFFLIHLGHDKSLLIFQSVETNNLVSLSILEACLASKINHVRLRTMSKIHQ